MYFKMHHKLVFADLFAYILLTSLRPHLNTLDSSCKLFTQMKKNPDKRIKVGPRREVIMSTPIYRSFWRRSSKLISCDWWLDNSTDNWQKTTLQEQHENLNNHAGKLLTICVKQKQTKLRKEWAFAVIALRPGNEIRPLVQLPSGHRPAQSYERQSSDMTLTHRSRSPLGASQLITRSTRQIINQFTSVPTSVDVWNWRILSFKFLQFNVVCIV